MTPETKAALDRARRAVRSFQKAGDARDESIFAAAEAGATLREIAEATGLSKPRVGQIVDWARRDLARPRPS